MTRRTYLRREDRYMRAARLGDAPSILAASLERVSTVNKGQVVTDRGKISFGYFSPGTEDSNYPTRDFNSSIFFLGNRSEQLATQSVRVMLAHKARPEFILM